MNSTYYSKFVVCDICGKKCRARGLKSHIRLLHNLDIKVRTEVKQVDKIKSDLSSTQVRPKSDSSPTQVKKNEVVPDVIVETVYVEKREYFPMMDYCPCCKEYVRLDEILWINNIDGNFGHSTNSPMCLDCRKSFMEAHRKRHKA